MLKQNDISINPEKLNETINLLKQDNEEINSILTNIWDILFDLDYNVWKSPEKDKLNETLLPYIKRKKESFQNYFNNCIYELQKELTNYVETNDINLKDTNNLLGSNGGV